MNRRLPTLSAFVLMAFLISACGGGAATPTSATKADAKPTQAAAPASSPSAAAAASPGAAASPAASAGGSAAGKPVARAVQDPGPCTAANATKPLPSGKARLVIGTGGTGGVYFPYGGGLARIVTARLPNAEMTAEVTGGSVDNMKLINAGEADLGMSTADSAYDAFNGTDVYKDTGKISACAIAVPYDSFIHIIALGDSNINTVADMKGKRISVGSAGSSTEGAADRILEVAGLDPRRDVVRDNLGVAESVGALKDRKIEAMFWIGGLPTAAVTDLVQTPNMRVKFIPGQPYIEPLRAKFGPLYTPFALPRTTYAGLDADVPGIGIGNMIFVNANMNEGLVYDILKTIFDNLSEVQQIHPEARSLTLAGAASSTSIPFHPGAVRFYQERGVW
ncbi:MAG: TAXI family TRAP transporter solute-binding subunit [Chloroflexota bacterium]